jgi:FdhE protein
MTIREQDLTVLRALTEAREQHEELAELLDFYHDLFEVQFEAKAVVPKPQVRDDLATRWRLEGGIPQLTFDQLDLEEESFAELVTRVGDVLCRHNPAWESMLSERSPREQVALAKEVYESWDTLTSPKPGIERSDSEASVDQPQGMAVGFALAPYLQRAAEAILPNLDLTLWSQSHCPVCGGRPNFALLEEERGARQLMCSRCNSLWPYARVGCAFCESKEKQIYYPSEDGVYRLYVCPACNDYLKTMDLRGVFREVYPVVERFLTVGMDLAAKQEGYGESRNTEADPGRDNLEMD